MMNGTSDLSNLDKKKMNMDSSSQEIIHTDDTDDVPTHPAVLSVFRAESILEQICSHLAFYDLKAFRLVSRICNDEGRRALIKLDRHWVVVYDDWQRKLGKVLKKLKKTTSDGCENSNQKLHGWIFKRLEINNWEYSFGNPNFLKQWGHYLRKIHLNAYEEKKKERILDLKTFHFMKTIHQLLTVCCPNLDEMVVNAEKFETEPEEEGWSSALLKKVERLKFPSPLPKLKCLRIKSLLVLWEEQGEWEILPTFFTRLVTAAGTALEKLQIDYNNDFESSYQMEKMVLESLELNVGVSSFQSLKEITLESAYNVANLSRTVQKCFPELTKLIIRSFDSCSIHGMREAMRDPRNYHVFPESFPALKSLTIQSIGCEFITNGKVLYFLRHFPSLEILNVCCMSIVTHELTDIPDPMAPTSPSLRSLSFKTDSYDLRLLRCVVKFFPNLFTLNLLEFGKGNVRDEIREPEYSFGELIDTISPLGCLKRLYVNHAFHTSPQLVNALQFTSYLEALDTFILSQAAHDLTKQHFNVSLYLSILDPEFQFILDCGSVTRLQSVRLLDFRFATTKEEVEDEAVTKGGHISFGTICNCYLHPWICGSCLKTCYNTL